jgi:hypothetical protein
VEHFAFTCPCCGKEVVSLPDIAYDAPVYYAALSEEERKTTARLSSDFCSVGDDRFIRAVCRIPVVNSDVEFGWGVWVSLSQENFQRYFDSYEDSDQSKLGNMFGWLSNELPGYPDTLNLQTTVMPQDNNQRPLVYISDVHADHPLFIEQREGVSQDKLVRIYAENLCSSSSPNGEVNG